MKALIVMVALALSLPVAAQRPAEREFSLNATGDIEIAADGTVHTYKLDKGQKPLIEQALDKSIRGWRFEPILVDGRPVIAKTRMRIVLDAHPIIGGDYALKVSNVWFGEPGRSNKLRPPRYPTDAAMANLGARVVLVLKLDREGNVVQQHVEQISLSARAANENIAESWRRKFEQASIAAAKRWKFDVTEVINGETVAGSVRVPVDYMMGSGSVDNKWRAFVPGPKHPVPWVSSEAIASQNGEGLGDGDVQPLDSRFKLKTNLVGTML